MTTTPTLLLRAKRELYHHLQGQHLFSLLGEGYTFAELQAYQLGDDIRHISWINSAKRGELYIKKMIAQRTLNVAFLSLLDGRMRVGNKREILMQTLATLGLSAHEAHDPAVILNLVGDTLTHYPATTSLYHVESALDAIQDAPLLHQRLNPQTIAQQIMTHLPRPALLFVLGDFLDAIDLSVVAQKHQLILLIIRDPQEEYPTPQRATQLMNPLDDQPLPQRLTPRAIAHYIQQRQAHDASLMAHAHAHGIGYAKITTMEQILPQLIKAMG